MTIPRRGSKSGFSRDTTTKDVVDGGYLVFSLGIDSKFPTEREVIQGCFTLPSLDPVNHMTDRRIVELLDLIIKSFDNQTES